MEWDARTLGPLAFGAGAGVLAFLAGFTLTYLWRGRDIEDSLMPIDGLLELFEAEPIGAWRAAGWLFYSGHFVETRVTREFGWIEQVTYINLVGQGAGRLELLYFLPPVVLIVAGALAVIYGHAADARAGAKRGASVAFGYFPLVALGLILFSYGSTRPDPVPAIFVAGILYPVVFGGIGGVVWVHLVRRWS